MTDPTKSFTRGDGTGSARRFQSSAPTDEGCSNDRTGEREPHEWYGPCDGFGPYGECSVCTKRDREFEVGFNFLGWAHWSLGVHFDPQHPHLDIHVIGGFLRIGWYSIKVSNRRLKRGDRPKYTRLIGGNPLRDRTSNDIVKAAQQQQRARKRENEPTK